MFPLRVSSVLEGFRYPRKQIGSHRVVPLCGTGRKNMDVLPFTLRTGLPWSGKNIWKMKFFPGQGKVREFCGWPGKFRKDLESQGKFREFENKWLWQAIFRKFIILFKRGMDVLSHEIV